MYFLSCFISNSTKDFFLIKRMKILCSRFYIGHSISANYLFHRNAGNQPVTLISQNNFMTCLKCERQKENPLEPISGLFMRQRKLKWNLELLVHLKWWREKKKNRLSDCYLSSRNISTQIGWLTLTADRRRIYNDLILIWVFDIFLLCQ